jgi:hypothetical protein
MVEFYLGLLFIICFGLIGWGMLKSERIYQFPFYMGAIFVPFILPQAVSLVYYNSGVVTVAGLQNVLIVSCLCVAMCGIGFYPKANVKFIRAIQKLEFQLDNKKLLIAGVIVSIIGSICQYITLVINADYAASGGWTGPITIVYFFGQIYYVGLAILIQSFVRKMSFSKAMILALTLAPVLFRIIINGRRSPTAGLLVLIGATLFFERKILPPRLLVLGTVISAVVLIPIFGLLRFGFWEQLFSGQLTVAQLQRALDGVLSGKVLELRNAAVVIEYVNQKDIYGLGSGYWNSLVFQFIPAQIFGKLFKDSLYIQTGLSGSDFQQSLAYYFSYSFSIGTTPTGIGDSFMEFGYFGCFLFGLLAYFFKNLWVSATYYKGSFSRIIYVSIISCSHWMVTHGTYTFFASNLVFQGLVLIAIRRFASSKQYSVIRLS